MRGTFAHDAVVDMAPDGDLRGPGGAITLALCGANDHPPPCPLAPHATRSGRGPDGVAVRVLFAADPADEAQVRARIDEALAAGWADAPDGARTRWTLLSSAPGTVAADEREHAARLAR